MIQVALPLGGFLVSSSGQATDSLVRNSSLSYGIDC